jgi:hypothetical protein
MKEQYIQMRNKQELDNRFLWNYYKEQGGKMQNPNEFLNYLLYTEENIEMQGFVVGKKTVLRDFTPILNYLDKQFNLTVLYNKDGNFIKVIA